MGETINTILRLIDGLAERAQKDERVEEALATVLIPLSSVITGAFERFAAEVRVLESEVGPQRAWMLIEARDDLVALTSEEKAAQLEAAKRLARAMIPPKLGPAANRRLKVETKDAGIGEREYLETAVFPDGLIVAVAEIDSPQRVRFASKYVWKEGKTSDIQPIYDLSIGQFVEWLYQKTSGACDAILTQRTYPADDALNAIGGGENEIDRAIVDGNRRMRGDKKPVRIIAAFNVERNPTEDKIIDAESEQAAQKKVSELLKKASPKERAWISGARARGGDLLVLLREQGYSPATIRQIRHRFRLKLSK